MKILVIYQIESNTDRNTIFEHLYSFSKIENGNSFHYLNIFDCVPQFVKKIKYDAVIFHYTFLAGERFLSNEIPWKNKISGMEELSGYKIAIPQDEYDFTDRLCAFFKKVNVQAVYTCFTQKEDIELAYPYDKTGVLKFFPVFTGYVDEKKIPDLAKRTRPFCERPIDIGYRARMLPAYFGRHGQLKYNLVDVFANAVKGTDLVTDIGNTNDNFHVENLKLVKHGDAWNDFLLECKAFVGCEGGSSLLDSDGSIKESVHSYMDLHPDATFDEIERNCFPGQDFNISCFALSPRHFESAMTRTLQILVEGNYGGVFLPWKHYIPLKKDFSNISEVLAALKDAKKCQEIIDTAYMDIVLSGAYTYKNFAAAVLSDIEESVKNRMNLLERLAFPLQGLIIKFRNAYYLQKPIILRWFIKSKFYKAVYPTYSKYVKPFRG